MKVKGDGIDLEVDLAFILDKGTLLDGKLLYIQYLHTISVQNENR
jgi:hypothetical protein